MSKTWRDFAQKIEKLEAERDALKVACAKHMNLFELNEIKTLKAERDELLEREKEALLRVAKLDDEVETLEAERDALL